MLTTVALWDKPPLEPGILVGGRKHVATLMRRMGIAALYQQRPTVADGVLFDGEKGLLFSDAWGVGGVVKLKGDAKCRGVHEHEACKPVPFTLPRMPGQDHMGEWLRACKGGPATFQGFETAADVCEIAAGAPDCNGDGVRDIGDAIYLLSYLFLGGPAPVAPGPTYCGLDSTEDALPPCSYEGCS